MHGAEIGTAMAWSILFWIEKKTWNGVDIYLRYFFRFSTKTKTTRTKSRTKGEVCCLLHQLWGILKLFRTLHFFHTACFISTLSIWGIECRLMRKRNSEYFSIRLQHSKMWKGGRGSEYFLNALHIRQMEAAVHQTQAQYNFWTDLQNWPAPWRAVFRDLERFTQQPCSPMHPEEMTALTASPCSPMHPE